MGTELPHELQSGAQFESQAGWPTGGLQVLQASPRLNQERIELLTGWSCKYCRKGDGEQLLEAHPLNITTKLVTATRLKMVFILLLSLTLILRVCEMRSQGMTSGLETYNAANDLQAERVYFLQV